MSDTRIRRSSVDQPSLAATATPVYGTDSNVRGPSATPQIIEDDCEQVTKPRLLKLAPINFHTGGKEDSKRDKARKKLIAWGIPRFLVIPFFAWLGLTVCARPEAKPSNTRQYLVVGIFSNSRGTCRESCLRIQHETFLFWQL